MNKNLERVIEIPSGVEVLISGHVVTVKSSGKEVRKEFDMGKIKVSVEGSEIKLVSKNASRRESKMIGTIWAHLKNMISGVQKDFVYEMEICNVHFPMNVKINGDEITIKSFLGEKQDRFAKIMPETKVDIKGSFITITSHNKEMAGQTAANIEKATKLTGRDRRIFQDGIFITNKCGRKI
ncbi:MAG: 50S ribosomal protein L6 [archaeon]